MPDMEINCSWALRYLGQWHCGYDKPTGSQPTGGRNEICRDFSSIMLSELEYGLLWNNRWTAEAPIDFLFIHESSDFLACGDSTGRVMARKISHRKLPGQKDHWEVDNNLQFDAYTSRKDLAVLKEVLVSVKNCRVLLSTGIQDTLWPIPTQPGDGWITRIDQDKDNILSPLWMSSSDDSSTNLLRVSSGRKTIEVYKWSKLELVRSVSLELEMNEIICQFAGFRHSQYFATLSICEIPGAKDLRAWHRIRGKKTIRLWDFARSEKDGLETLSPHSRLTTLPPSVEIVVGVFWATSGSLHF
ncbi:hypothetical protein QBC38DRAFT_459043 [Podospora fimiseda]|uniref:Uncharacterized protein n=1 Tax=Podospora fimiseda TaxID=252190 RepID=A0AAN7BHS4_9PEZI|nr:hypothetical protein QBC38DRAFT_459043 [Podospora fimiseda]